MKYEQKVSLSETDVIVEVKNLEDTDERQFLLTLVSAVPITSNHFECKNSVQSKLDQSVFHMLNNIQPTDNDDED
jgi:hypothetical protein